MTALKRLGITKDTFAPGMTIKAQGPPSRQPGTYGMNTDSITLPDGREIKQGAGGGVLDIQ